MNIRDKGGAASAEGARGGAALSEACVRVTLEHKINNNYDAASIRNLTTV